MSGRKRLTAKNKKEAELVAKEARDFIEHLKYVFQQPTSGHLPVTPVNHMALSLEEQYEKESELRELENKFIHVFQNPVEEEAEHEELLRNILATIEHYLMFYYDLSGHNFLQSERVKVFRDFLGEDPDKIEAAFHTISAMSGGRRLKKSKKRATGKKNKKSKKSKKTLKRKH